MIYLYSGTPGSGKSLHAAERIYCKLKMGRPVIANFEINLDNFKKKVPFYQIDNFSVTVDDLKKISFDYFKTHKFKEGGITLFLDECQLLFNSRDYQAKNRMEWLSFFSQHRHYGFDIILIAQFDRMLDRQIRSLIEYEFTHRKCSNFGKLGFWIKLFAFGDVFLCIERYYPIKYKVGQSFFRAHKRYYSLYDTYGEFHVMGTEPVITKPISSNQKKPSAAAAVSHGVGAPCLPAPSAQGLRFDLLIMSPWSFDCC